MSIPIKFVISRMPPFSPDSSTKQTTPSNKRTKRVQILVKRTREMVDDAFKF